jgi:hypothetical protein
MGFKVRLSDYLNTVKVSAADAAKQLEPPLLETQAKWDDDLANSAPDFVL